MLDRLILAERRIEELERQVVILVKASTPPRRKALTGVAKERLWEFVRANPGCSTASVAKEMGGRYTRDEYDRLIFELALQGKIIEKIPNPQHTGGRRGDAWFAREEAME